MIAHMSEIKTSEEIETDDEIETVKDIRKRRLEYNLYMQNSYTFKLRKFCDICKKNHTINK